MGSDGGTGLDMKNNVRLSLVALCLFAVAAVLTGCSSSKSNPGVASMDQLHTPDTSDNVVLAAPEEQPTLQSNANVPDSSASSGRGSGRDVDTADNLDDTSELTDEEIVTRFTACIREHGLNVPDPEVNADGTINFAALRASFAQAFSGNLRSIDAVKVREDCGPLLALATFAQPRSTEDEIELQDRLLEFTECLRDAGIDVPDPDFSGSPRAAMSVIGQELRNARGSMQEDIDSCVELTFGEQGSGRRFGARR